MCGAAVENISTGRYCEKYMSSLIFIDMSRIRICGYIAVTRSRFHITQLLYVKTHYREAQSSVFYNMYYKSYIYMHARRKSRSRILNHTSCSTNVVVALVYHTHTHIRNYVLQYMRVLTHTQIYIFPSTLVKFH